MPSFATPSPTPRPLGDFTAVRLDLIRLRLASILGSAYTVILTVDTSGAGIDRYDLAVEHAASQVRLEDSGELDDGFAEHVLRLAAQVKGMLESPRFAHMCSDDPGRPLVWLSDAVVTA